MSYLEGYLHKIISKVHLHPSVSLNYSSDVGLQVEVWCGVSVQAALDDEAKERDIQREQDRWSMMYVRAVRVPLQVKQFLTLFMTAGHLAYFRLILLPR